MSTQMTAHAEQSATQSTAEIFRDKTSAISWLAWQCQMVSGVIRGAVYRPDSIGVNSARAVWPEVGVAEPQLVAAANQALKKKASTRFSKIGYGQKGQRACDVIACPIEKDGELYAVVAFAMSIRSEPQQQAVLQLIRWGGMWLDTRLESEQSASVARYEFAIGLSRFVAGQPDTLTAAIATVDALADGIGCDRVSLGFVRDQRVRLKAMSGAVKFDSQTPLVRSLETAMDEAANCRAVVAVPDTIASTLPSAAHRELCMQSGLGSCVSVPMEDGKGIVGVITFERAGESGFDQQTVTNLRNIANLLGSTLSHKLRLERPVLTLIQDLARRWTVALFGPRKPVLKIGLLLVSAVVVVTNLVTTTYTVSAPIRVEGEERQIISAPMNGYINAARVRAGDAVVAGQEIARLDNRKLLLEREQRESERHQVQQEYFDAVAHQDKAEIARFKAQLKQKDAELALIDVQLGRATLTAPYDGVVISGDLSQTLGSPIKVGDVLFEIAPLDNYRVLLEVDERDVAHIEAGQAGTMVVTALPDKTFDLHIEKISPLASVNQSGNHFLVQATLNADSPQLRPGMRGIARIESSDQTIWWTWTHRLAARMSIFFWSLGL